MHVPKTAGSAFRKLLERQYGEDAAYCYHPKPAQVSQKLREALPHKPALLAAHFDFSQLDEEVLTHYKLLLFLRHPVARTISQYLFIKHSPWQMHQEMHGQWQNFEGFLQSPFAQNFQCRFLSGYRLAPVSIGNEELLHKSLITLQRVDGLGITEHYEDSVWLLTQRYGWKKPLIKKVNQNPHRQEAERLQKNYQDLLLRQNEADIALYEEATKRHFAERGALWQWKKWWYALRGAYR